MTTIPELTPRQRAFLDKLVEMYAESHTPVHYSDVAERLGVSPFSAYDMLKVLESKGCASSSYSLASGHSGPGRSSVMFAPSHEAVSLLVPKSVTGATRPAQSGRLGEDWPGLKDRLLRKLRDARGANPREALNELLARLPEAKAPLTYCAEMIGVLLLNMQRARAGQKWTSGLNPFRALAALRTSEDAGLETLAGLSLGSTLSDDDEAGPSLTHRLLDLARRYQANLPKLSAEARSALAQFLGEALAALD